MRTRLSLLLFVVSAGHARAQVAPTASDTILVPWSLLSERPRLRETSPIITSDFPSMLQGAMLAGEVRLRMIVSADGLPTADRDMVEFTTHPLFTSAVLHAVRRWTLTPPMHDGHAVRTTMPVFASFPVVSDREVPTRQINTVESDSTGLHIVVGWEIVPRTPGLAANAGDRRAAFTSILSDLATIAERSNANAVCVKQEGTSNAKLRSDVFQRLRAAHARIRDRNHCPPTFDSMMLRTDASGKPIPRPKGSVDPMWISAPEPRPWTTDLYVLQGSIGQGTGGTRYQCEARRLAPGAVWEAKCVAVAHYVH